VQLRSVKNLMRLDGRSALVVGGGGYIGSAMAEALAEAGAQVALADFNRPQMIAKAAEISQATGMMPSIHEVDLAKEDEVRALPDAVVGVCGGLDILINCAALGGASKLEGWAERFENQGTKSWRMALEVNLTSVFELVQASLPHLRARKLGSVINVASIYGVVGPDWTLYDGTSMANPAAYGASKGGLIQLTRYLATTLAPDVRVNTISPGGVARGQPQSFVDRYEQRTPMRRMATEEDFKGVTAFLASDLSSYITGQNIIVDGGWCAW
jgi:NAD(P)-dependent dehydrogenase (short-subunit alcohol dehydrogenase family)